MTDDAVSLRGVSVTYPGPRSWLGTRRQIRAVQDVTLDIPRGTALGLIGAAGSGASSVALASVHAVPFAGAVRIVAKEGTQIALGTSSRGVRKSLQTHTCLLRAPPRTALPPRLTVREIILARLPKDSGTGEARLEQVNDIAGRCSLAQTVLGLRPPALSHNQRVRVALAAALAQSPSYLVADDLFDGLDIPMRAEAINRLCDLKEAGASLLVTAHDPGDLVHLCERIAVMSEGRVVECAPTAQILDAPAHAVTAALVAASGRLPPAPPEADPAGPATKGPEASAGAHGAPAHAVPSSPLKQPGPPSSPRVEPPAPPPTELP